MEAPRLVVSLAAAIVLVLLVVLESNPAAAQTLECANVPALEHNYYQYVLFRKRLHQEVLYHRRHPLLRSNDLDQLARAHSEYMAGQGALSNSSVTYRRSTIVSNAYSYFSPNATLTNQRYEPIGVVRVDELYGTGSDTRQLWYDYFENNPQVVGATSRSYHNWIGVGVHCAGSGTNTVAWATLILVTVCHAPTDNYQLPAFDNQMCTSLNTDQQQCLTDTGATGDALFFANGSSSAGPVAFTCGTLTLNGASAFPVTPATETATAVVTAPVTSVDAGTLCMTLTHDFNAGVNAITAMRFHFGAAGQETESAPLYSVPGPWTSPLELCWDYGSTGLPMSMALNGRAYLNIHSQTSDASPGSYNGWIRGQIQALPGWWNIDSGLAVSYSSN